MLVVDLVGGAEGVDGEPGNLGDGELVGEAFEDGGGGAGREGAVRDGVAGFDGVGRLRRRSGSEKQEPLPGGEWEVGLGLPHPPSARYSRQGGRRQFGVCRGRGG